MPRQAKPHWCKDRQCYRTEAGGRPKYFRGIAREDHVAIAVAFAEYVAGLRAAARPPEPDAAAVCREFLNATRGVSSRTVRTHRERLSKFSLWQSSKSAQPIGARKAADLKAADLRAAMATWKGEGISDHYRAGICRSVKAAFAWAASEEGGRLIPANPFKEVGGPKIERSPERYAERKEVADFLRFAWRKASDSTPTYRVFGRLLVLMIRIGAHTGIRPGDLCSAWWEDFDPRKRTITLPPDRHKTGKRTGRPLLVFLTPPLVRALLRERDRDGRHPVAIFTHKRGRGGVDRGATREAGEPWGEFVEKDGRPSFESDSTPLSQAIRKLRMKAESAQRARRAAAIARGVPEAEAPRVTITSKGDNRFVFYRLRHTVASDYLMRGGSSATVAELLGTSPKMLETTYGHLLEGHLSEEAKRLRAGKRPST